MRLSTLLKLGVLVGIGLTVALIAAVKSIDVESYRRFVTAQIQSATGRPVTIAGQFELKIGLVPSLVATGVTFANMPGGTRPEMATVERIEASIALIPLLSREIQVRKLVLIKPDVLMETDAKGRANWVFSAGSEPVGTDGPPTRFDVRQIRIEDAHLTWRDGKAGVSRQAVIGKLSIEPERGADGPLKIELGGEYAGEKVAVAGVVGAPAILGTGKPWPFQVKGTIDGTVVAIDGTATDPLAGKGFDFNLAAQGDELTHPARLAGLLPADAKPLGPFRLSARLADRGKLALTELDMAVGKRETGLVSAKGRIEDLAGLRGVELAAALETENLASLSQVAGTELPAMGPLKLAGILSDTPSGWRLAEIKGGIGGGDVQGELLLDLGKRPRLTGNLRSNALALADFDKGDHKGAGDGRIFPATPLPLETLKNADADLTLAVTKLGIGKVTITDASAEARLRQGRLTVKPIKGLLAGGVLDGELSLDATGAGAVRLSGAGVDLGRLSKETGSDLISGGRTDARIDLRGKGATVRALAASLSGNAVLSVGEGRIHNRAVNWAGGDILFQILGSLNPLAASDETTEMTCGVINFAVANGVATASKGIAVETSKVNVVGSGTVDLRSEAIDIGITPRARQGVGLSLGGTLAGLTRVRGTLAEPSVGIDELGTARTAASVGAAVATGGLSLLGELLYDKVAADDSPCRTALGKPSTKAKKSEGGLLDGLFGR